MPRELPKEQTNFTLFVTSPISDDGLMDRVNNMFEMNSYMFQIEEIKFLLFFFKCSHRIRLMSFMLQMCITYHTFLNFLYIEFVFKLSNKLLRFWCRRLG